jgi:hypothetical protein
VSLRPEVSGFRLDVLRGVLGCGDPATAERAAAHVLESAGSERGRVVAGVARDLVMGARPAPEDEDEDVIAAVVSLAGFGQEHLTTGSSSWKSYFQDWAFDEWKVGDGGPTLPEDTDPETYERIEDLLFWALVARPLVGRRQTGSWTTYGYLTHAEVGELLGLAERYPGLRADPEGFGADFFDWLREIHDAGLDYWFFCE